MQFTNEFNGNFRMNEPPSVQLPDLMDFISVEQQSSNTNPPPSNNKPTQFKFTEMAMENTAPQIKKHNNNTNNNNNNVIIIDVPKPKPNHYPHHQQQQPHQQPFIGSSGFSSDGMNPVIHANFDEPSNPPSSTNAADFKAKLERRRKGLNKGNQP